MGVLSLVKLLEKDKNSCLRIQKIYTKFIYKKVKENKLRIFLYLLFRNFFNNLITKKIAFLWFRSKPYMRYVLVATYSIEIH